MDGKKIEKIEKKLKIESFEEDEEDFDNWKEKIPENSLESPLKVNNIFEIDSYLPRVANYTEEKVNIFFQKSMDFSSEELKNIFKNFSLDNSNFEISIVRHDDNIISIGIGNKVRNGSTILDNDTEYFGHFHPTDFDFENEEILPDCFLAGVMPSIGDIKGYLKRKHLIKNGTRIFSKCGYSKITLVDDFKEDINLKKMEEKYFDLFLGENKFKLKTDEEIANAFEKELGLKIEFFYDGKK